MDEKQAIQRLKNSDIGGLEYLVERYQLKAVRTAYLITQDIELAEDIVQDSFIQAFRSIHRFDTNCLFEPWFLRTVVNTSVKMMQRSARYIQIGDNTDDLVFEAGATWVESVESLVEMAEVQHQLWEAMQKLSPRQRAVIVQRYYLGMSEAEMAGESGTSGGTIKWLLHMARERMRLLLARRSEK